MPGVRVVPARKIDRVAAVASLVRLDAEIHAVEVMTSETLVEMQRQLRRDDQTELVEVITSTARASWLLRGVSVSRPPGDLMPADRVDLVSIVS